MIDIHSHILYGIDDGARTKEESIELLKKQRELGFTDIILTPHYIENTNYEASINQKQKLINEINKYPNNQLNLPGSLATVQLLYAYFSF